MKLTIATKNDLPDIKTLYKNIVASMYQNNVFIWDDYYPYEIIKEDIKNQTFYLVKKDNKLIGGFALNKKHKAFNSIQWQDHHALAIYLDRFGIHSDYSNQGIASKLLEQIEEIIKQNNEQYLRLFVVESNLPAIQFYLKNDFHRSEGIYGELMNTGVTLYEYAYEKKIKID